MVFTATLNKAGTPQFETSDFDWSQHALPTVPAQGPNPRPPARIIVLCDGTAQQRNWVKSSTNATVKGNENWFKRKYHETFPCWSTDAKLSLSALEANAQEQQPEEHPSVAAQSGDFFTNVALLAKVLEGSSRPKSESSKEDGKSGSLERVMEQIVFYQSGVGTTTGFLQNVYDRGTGLSLGAKVQEAYGFISDNYQPGDELFLFGFSRGAYTARCISGLIGWCGILDKVEMTHFADIWAAYQGRDPDKISTERTAADVLFKVTGWYPSEDSEEMATTSYEASLKANKHLSKDDREDLKAKRQKECDDRKKKIIPPPIKVVGVWDTVRALSYPGCFQSKASFKFYDFYDPGLGSNIQFAFHALSLEEDRKDFLPTLWYQPKYQKKGGYQRERQVLKQCWFQGVHTDCGGGYQYHGLSDITLIWMVSQLMDEHVLPDKTKTMGPLLNVDLALLSTVLDRRRKWAKQIPNRSRPTVNFQKNRSVHFRGDNLFTHQKMWSDLAAHGRTYESIHPSVVHGGRINRNHPAFDFVRQEDSDWLNKAWAEASEDLHVSLRPTEKLLYWRERGPYPIKLPTGDVARNPISTRPTNGSWNFPVKVGLQSREALTSGATLEASVEDYYVNGVEHSGDSDGDVDDQVASGWPTNADFSAHKPGMRGAAPPESNGSSSPTHIMGDLGYPMRKPKWRIIPSYELGENPVDPLAHPWLHSTWPFFYWLAALPNRVFVDVFNRPFTPSANLHQTGSQSLVWKLGDKLGGFSEGDKLKALMAGQYDKPIKGQKQKAFKKVPYIERKSSNPEAVSEPEF